MPIDHAGLSVHADIYAETLAFHLAALAPLGYEKIVSYGPHITGTGANGKPDWWIFSKEEKPLHVTHVAFTAADRKTVDAFYEAAIAAGGKDNGKPGLRPQSHPNYYGAYVIDPAGNNIEAVCHAPE